MYETESKQRSSTVSDVFGINLLHRPWRALDSSKHETSWLKERSVRWERITVDSLKKNSGTRETIIISVMRSDRSNRSSLVSSLTGRRTKGGAHNNAETAPSAVFVPMLVFAFILVSFSYTLSWSYSRNLSLTAMDLTFLSKSWKHTSSSHQNHPRLPRVLAMYFPQFHPDPLNDRIWQENFTDWFSLQAASSHNRFGYRLPRPSELGYYDLRNVNVRTKQGQLAREYDLDGFVVHHYWFYDRSHPGPTLHAPITALLDDGQPNVPFFFQWCNERWTNVWMGQAMFHRSVLTARTERIVLQDQYYNVTAVEVREHYNWLAQYFHHPNYIRVNDQPVLMVYQHDDRINPILKRLRRFAVQDGFSGLYYVAGRRASHEVLFPLSDRPLDERLRGEIERLTQPLEMFPPHVYNKTASYPYSLEWVNESLQVPDWCRNKPKGLAAAPASKLTSSQRKAQQIHSAAVVAAGTRAGQEIPGVLPVFDNTPRRGYYNSTIWNADMDPEQVLDRFETSLWAAVYYETCCLSDDDDENDDDDGDSRFVLVNAWNEWAEGMSLEPSDVYGRRLLEVVRRAKERVRRGGCIWTEADEAMW